MTAEACRGALEAADIHKRALALDAAFPKCACEEWSLCANGGEPVDNGELFARILTSPDAYDEDAETILTSKLTRLYSLGLSVVRQGASDEEILQTVEELLGGAAEPRKLVGAVVMEAGEVRAFANDDDRWFGVYATDAGDKVHHIDVFGTIPAGTNSAIKRITSERRYALADGMKPKIVFEDEPHALIAKLREAGI